MFDIDRALCVLDCDRFYNFMCFAMVTFAVAGGPGQNDKHHNYTRHGSHGDGRNGTPSETQFLRVVRMGLNHTCPHCEHGISKLNEPNASICQTFLATSSPPTTNEAQVEFDHRMLCTLGTFKNHRQVLTSPRYPPRDRLTLFFAKVTRSLFCGLGTLTMTEELMRKLPPMMRMIIQRGTQVSVPQPVMPTTAKPTIPRQTKPPSFERARRKRPGCRQQPRSAALRAKRQIGNMGRLHSASNAYSSWLQNGISRGPSDRGGISRHRQE